MNDKATGMVECITIKERKYLSIDDLIVVFAQVNGVISSVNLIKEFVRLKEDAKTN